MAVMPTLTLQQAFDLAVQHHQAGRLVEAEPLYRQILAVAPAHAETLHLLGVIALQVGRNDVAVDLIRQAIALLPTILDFHSNLGLALTKRGDLDAAIAAFHRALELQPDSPTVHNNLGNALKDQGRFAEAIAAYRQALQLQPDAVEAHNNLGVALAHRGHFDEAIAAYRRALQLKPDYAEASNNLGNALKDQGRLDEAVTAFRRALALKADYAAAHVNLSNALQEQGKLDEAIEGYHRAIQCKPDYAEAHGNLANVLKEQARFEEAMDCYKRATAFNPQSAALHSNLVYAMLFHPAMTHRRLREETARWQQQHGARLMENIPPHKNTPNPERRLKVGYVSPDFWHHVICHFLTPLVEAHDHARFEIFCYASVKRPDPITERIRKSADHWRDVLGMRAETLAELIRADGIDLLVDLTQHMADNRMPLFARKPAPVQVAWLGYPGSTGLESINYRLTDAWMEPAGAAWTESVETPVRLPDSWFCFDPIDEYPATGPLPALRTGHVTFGCLNSFSKVNEAVTQCWAEVLRAVEGSRLLLRCPEGATQARVRQFFEAQGIAAERVEPVSWTPTRKEFLDLFQRIDIALDPFPYNGGTTTCEALWMGIPVLTLPGSLTVSRIGLSILSAAGLPELVAHSAAEYVRLAASLAGDLPRLAQLRATLRERMKASPFMDAPRFARNVEQAYREMWRAWCAKQSG